MGQKVGGSCRIATTAKTYLRLVCATQNRILSHVTLKAESVRVRFLLRYEKRASSTNATLLVMLCCSTDFVHGQTQTVSKRPPSLRLLYLSLLSRNSSHQSLHDAQKIQPYRITYHMRNKIGGPQPFRLRHPPVRSEGWGGGGWEGGIMMIRDKT